MLDLSACDTSNFNVQTPGEMEVDLFNSYKEIEEYLRSRHDVDDAELNEYMQALIDEGVLSPPFIIVGDSYGVNFRTVTYQEYREYRSNNPIGTARQFIIKDNLQELLIDSTDNANQKVNY